MIYAIGHDIVNNNRIKKLYVRYGLKFINKILSETEKTIFNDKNEFSKVPYLAKRFAAKEAFAKACGIGVVFPILLTGISIVNDTFGKPTFDFNNDIKEWLAMRNINKCHLSLSDENELSSAVVILCSNWH